MLITYSLATAAEAGLAFPVVFAVAMGLHFVITDRTMERNHPDEFDHRGRFVLAGALLLGWVLGAVTGHGSEPVVAFTAAFLSGAVLLNVFKEEVHVDRDTSLPVFLLGTGTGVVLLFWITVAGG